MIDTEKITAVLDSDEGSTLLAELTKLILQTNYPEHIGDEAYQAMCVISVTKELANETVPDGMSCYDFAIQWLKAMIDYFRNGSNEPEPEPQPYTPQPRPYTPTANTSYPKRSIKQILLGAYLTLGAIVTPVSFFSSEEPVDSNALAPVIISCVILAVVGIVLLVKGFKKKIR